MTNWRTEDTFAKRTANWNRKECCNLDVKSISEKRNRKFSIVGWSHEQKVRGAVG